MLKIETIATVTYTCELSDEEERQIIQYIKDNPNRFEFMNEEEQIILAINVLYDESKLDLYDAYVESDFCTEEVRWSEFESRSAQEILNT